MKLDDLIHLDQPAGVSSRMARVAYFIVTLLIATVIYLLSGAMIVSTVLPCIHAGWSTLSSGLWILQVDPVRARARVCFTFYLAAACWKAACAALITVVTFAVVANKTGIEPSLDKFVATMWVLIAGVVLNMVLGLAATVAAISRRVRVWVQPQLQSRYLGDLRWAARQSRIYPGFNHAIFVVGTALIFPTAALGCLLLAVLPIAVEREDTVSTSTMILIFMLVFGFPLAAIPCYAWISSRIIARHPVECWPPATLDHSFGNLVETPPHPMRSADAPWRSEL